jgi:protein-S-isoprenylcysteine O-methyltransferase Ste14
MIELNDALDWPRWSTAAGCLIGGGLILAGIVAVAYCSRLFSSIGRGTPVPLQPPKHMVIEGLYRYSRNPMYVAHTAILLGLFLYRGELLLLVYVGVYLAGMHTWIVRGEEPELRQRFRDEYVAYTQRVPRWISIRHRPVDR